MSDAVRDAEESIEELKSENVEVELNNSPNHDVPILSKQEMERNLLIGISGVQAAGKTVFLSAIFHTVNGEEIDDIGDVSFDRTDKGGAQYFEWIENEIREKGQAPPTQQPAVAKLLVEGPSLDGAAKETGVILFDFAGRYFTEFADLPAALERAETPAERRELQLVNYYLQECDAFIVLVDSQNFKLEEVAGERNPFPPTVVFLRSFCKKNNRPLALVFTKKDLNPDLTFEEIGEFEMVRKVRQLFSDDVEETTRPFGLVEHLSCYEVDMTDDVIEQSADATIWRSEPKEVFIKILRAAWPRVIAKHEAIDRKREQATLREQEVQRSKTIKRMLIAALLLLVLSIPFLWGQASDYLKLREAVTVGTEVSSSLERNAPNLISPNDLAKLQWLSQQGTSEERSVLFRRLRRELQDFLAIVPTTHPVTGDDSVATQRVLKLRDLLGMNSSSEIQMLQERSRYTAQLAAASTPEDKLRIVRDTLQTIAALGDLAFQEALEIEAANLRKEVGRNLVQQGYGESTLEDRVRFVRLGLRNLETGADSLMTLTARGEYGRFLGSSLAGLQERERLVHLIRTAAPKLAGLIVPEFESRAVLEYKLVRAEIVATISLEDARTLHSQIASSVEELVAGREESTKRLLAATLEDLFRGLTADGRRDVWTALLDGVESEYFFILRSDAWPRGAEPWTAKLRAQLAESQWDEQVSNRTATQIAMRSVYTGEASDIVYYAASRYLDFEVAQGYRSVRSEVEILESGYYATRQKLRVLASLASNLGAQHRNLFGTTPRHFTRQQEAVSSLREEVAELSSDDDYERDLLRRTVGNSLRSLCRDRLGLRGGDCAGL